ncbi:DUF397 domain-containing protein [Streptomyces sp. NPDC053048]|uniref:DUF397 domain-containing protein n=1 Tax=Streptomyces sp. NPDC053048 TaxID=3365694 RepID=UPI0037D4C7CF
MSTKLAWFKSSYSGTEGGNCIEVATGSGTTHVRDSKLELRGGSPQLAVPARTWGSFIAELRASGLERLL